MEQPRKRLGDILQEMDMISGQDIERALDHGRKKELRLGEALIDLGIITEEQILWTLAEQMGISFIRVSEEQLSPEVVRLIPEEMARRHTILPVIQVGGELTLAVADPLQYDLFQDIHQLTGLDVHLSLAKSKEITNALDQVWGMAAQEEDLDREMHSDRYGPEDIRAFTADKTGAAILERLVRDCLDQGVNMIHLDIRDGHARVRFREKGVLRSVLEAAPGWGRALLGRLGVLAGRGLEKERDLSFRAQMTVSGQPAALEVHRLRTGANDEAATIRVLGKRAGKMPLSKLGMTGSQRALVDMVLSRHGLIVVTGPSDSGRATTVMSLLDRFDPSSSRIVTMEDWVRTEHEDYLQVSSDALHGSNRIDTLAAMDPDVVYVESLETEEVEHALSLGMRGTFVFTLMGFSRARSALGYLTDLGVQPSLLAEGLSGIVAQALLPRLCDKCKVQDKVGKGALAGLPDDTKQALSKAKLYKPKGCKACDHTGYSGRIAVFEVLAPDDKLRHALASGTSMAEIPMDFGKPSAELPARVLDKVVRGQAHWKKILKLR